MKDEDFRKAAQINFSKGDYAQAIIHSLQIKNLLAEDRERITSASCNCKIEQNLIHIQQIADVVITGQ